MFRFSSPHLVLCFFWLPAFAYNITVTPYQTDRPAPGLVLFFDIQFQTSEPYEVDILLFNGNLGNTTTILSDVDLYQNSNSGFNIPFVPPGTAYAIRLLDSAKNDSFLQDSPPFQIFAVGSSDVSTSVLPSSLSTSLLVSSPDSTTTPSFSSPSTTSATPVSSPLSLPTSISLPTTVGTQGKIGNNKTSKIGPIVGAAIGGILGVAIIAIILLRLCLPNKPPTNGIKNLFNPIAVRTPKKLIHRDSPQIESLPLADAGPPPDYSYDAPARAEFLRQERERINREIALLEGRSSSGTDSSDSPLVVRVPPVPIAINIVDQSARLREEIRQNEIRQVYGPTVLPVAGSSDGPPPSYQR